jgi:plastocyanin
VGQASACRVRVPIGQAPLPLAILTLLLFAAAACGGSASAPSGTPVAPTNGSLTIRAFEWGFEPSNVILEQGQQVRIEFVNNGSTLHDLKIDGLDASGVVSKSNGGLSAKGDELFVAADKGKSGSLSFTPTKAGTFTFYCTISRHRQLGMKGTITVE